MNVIPPRRLDFCTHPARVTVCPAFSMRSSPQVCVLYIIISYLKILVCNGISRSRQGRTVRNCKSLPRPGIRPLPDIHRHPCEPLTAGGALTSDRKHVSRSPALRGKSNKFVLIMEVMVKRVL